MRADRTKTTNRKAVEISATDLGIVVEIDGAETPGIRTCDTIYSLSFAEVAVQGDGQLRRAGRPPKGLGREQFEVPRPGRAARK